MKLDEMFPGVKSFPANSNPYPDRFKDIQHIKHAEDDKDGLDAILTMENNNVLLDFGRPVQCVGFTLDDAKTMVIGLMEAIQLCMLKEAAGANVPKAKTN